MKLRTRIVCITSIAVIAACLLSDGIIWKLYQRNKREEAMIKGYQTSYTIMDDLISQIETMPPSQINSTYFNYYFKNRKDEYTVCIRMPDADSALYGSVECENAVELYNHTVFTPGDLFGMDYKNYDKLMYTEFTWEGGHYLIFAEAFLDNKEYALFHIVDINYVWRELERMIVLMLLITTAVVVTVIFLLSVVLKAVLRPLQDLNATARWIAEGLYGQRVTVKRQDEIGQLGESFNAMAEAVEVRTRNLEESEQRKTLFMGNLTHELKTPMTAISGYAQTLLSTRLSKEDEEEALHYIHEECGRLERLSKKMMKLLELDQEGEIEMQEIAVRRLFEAAEHSCKVILQNKQITLKVIEHGERFRMDLDLMTDVLINLIDNAVKASQPGGVICLTAEENRIQVQDFGQGIPAEEQERILEPFYMIDKSRSRKNGGAGLGLALTALIIKKHQAVLQIESEVGTGTRMILQFV